MVCPYGLSMLLDSSNKLSSATSFRIVDAFFGFSCSSCSFILDDRSFMHAHKSQRPCEEVFTSFNNAIFQHLHMLWITLS